MTEETEKVEKDKTEKEQNEKRKEAERTRKRIVELVLDIRLPQAECQVLELTFAVLLTGDTPVEDHGEGFICPSC